MSAGHAIFSLITKTIPSHASVMFLLRPGHDTVGKIHVKQIYEIAQMKQRDDHMSHLDLKAIASSIAGSAASMGLEVVKD